MSNWKNLFPKKNRYFETENGILYNVEAIETMGKFPTNIFDAIIADPPYGTTQCKWDSVIPFDDMWRELKMVRKDATPIVLFGNEPFSSYLRISNIKEYKYDWIWEKSKASNYLNSKKQPLRAYEIISVFYKRQATYNPQMMKGKAYNKGKAKRETDVYGKQRSVEVKSENGDRYPRNIIYFKTAEREGKLHPTQKPLDLLEYLIKTYTKEEDLILDFTAGSGTTLVSAEKLNRKWIGIELEEKYCRVAKDRIIQGMEGEK